MRTLLPFLAAAAVMAADNASIVSANFPSSMGAGATANVSVTVKNTGTSTWTKATAYRLGGVGDYDPFYPAARVDLGSTVSVAPGATYTFSFVFKAPAAPGSYTTDWQMLREGVQWFGGTVTKTISVTSTNPPPAGFVYVQAGHFKVGGQDWYPYGVNYWPHFMVNPPGGDYQKWLKNGYYSSSYVETDLAKIQSIGMNVVSIQAPIESAYIPNVVDFLNRCKNHGIRVFLSIAYADAFNDDMDNNGFTQAVYNFINNLAIKGHTAIFAYDIAWEPQLGKWDPRRSALDSVWSRWIQEHYGSISAASTAFGVPVPTSRTGTASGILWHNIPVRAVKGQSYSCSVAVKNMGSETWGVGGNIKLGRAYGTGTPARVEVSSAVSAGATQVFNFTYTAPTTPGRYTLRMQMVKEGYKWFGAQLVSEIEVISTGAAVKPTTNLPEPALAPDDAALKQNSPNNLVLAYRRCIDTEVSRRYSARVRWMKSVDPNHLISCRQGYGGNGSDAVLDMYPLELQSTAACFDFLCPENYAIGFKEPEKVRGGQALISSYCRWASDGKPVFWAETGWWMPGNPTAAQQQEQADYYGGFIDSMMVTDSDGFCIWWWPGGFRQGEDSDYGITSENGALRPACYTIQAKADMAKGPRTYWPGVNYGTVNLFGSSTGFYGIFSSLMDSAVSTLSSGKRFLVRGDGWNTTSNQPPVFVSGMPKHLWADITKVELKVGSGNWFEVHDGLSYAVPKNVPIQVRAEVVNMGDTQWMNAGSVSTGWVAFAANENVGLGFRKELTTQVPHAGRVIVPASTLTAGLSAPAAVQFQMVSENVAWMTGAIRIQIVAY